MNIRLASIPLIQKNPRAVVLLDTGWTVDTALKDKHVTVDVDRDVKRLNEVAVRIGRRSVRPETRSDEIASVSKLLEALVPVIDDEYAAILRIYRNPKSDIELAIAESVSTKGGDQVASAVKFEDTIVLENEHVALRVDRNGVWPSRGVEINAHFRNEDALVVK